MWEQDYRRRIERDLGAHTEFVGEVHGTQRRRLLTRARAVVALSQSVEGPWGARWCEPGAAVVTEAAMSGTPVVGSDNGCLAEIVPEVGTVIEGGDPRHVDAASVVESLPGSETVRDRAIALWGHTAIARDYVDLYERAASGERWGRRGPVAATTPT